VSRARWVRRAYSCEVCGWISTGSYVCANCAQAGTPDREAHVSAVNRAADLRREVELRVGSGAIGVKRAGRVVRIASGAGVAAFAMERDVSGLTSAWRGGGERVARGRVLVSGAVRRARCVAESSWSVVGVGLAGAIAERLHHGVCRLCGVGQTCGWASLGGGAGGGLAPALRCGEPRWGGWVEEWRARWGGSMRYVSRG
jgi:hypothetical protein